MSTTPHYEIHAIKYAEGERTARECFLMPDQHDGPMPIDSEPKARKKPMAITSSHDRVAMGFGHCSRSA